MTCALGAMIAITLAVNVDLFGFQYDSETTFDLTLFGQRGNIPIEIGLLTRLTSIDLSGCQLSGPIPTQLGLLKQLKYLDLSGNNLDGTIPTQLQTLSHLQSIALQNNKLSGDVPSQLSSLPSLTQLTLHGNPQLRKIMQSDYPSDTASESPSESPSISASPSALPEVFNQIACEHGTVYPSCSGGLVVEIVGANYGRTDFATCPGYEELVDNCTASESFILVSHMCNGQYDCAVSAINEIFGDPCVNTYKYINVSYICVEPSDLLNSVSSSDEPSPSTSEEPSLSPSISEEPSHSPAPSQSPVVEVCGDQSDELAIRCDAIPQSTYHLSHKHRVLLSTVCGCQCGCCVDSKGLHMCNDDEAVHWTAQRIGFDWIRSCAEVLLFLKCDDAKYGDLLAQYCPCHCAVH